jgi:hypothetical protein
LAFRAEIDRGQRGQNWGKNSAEQSINQLDLPMSPPSVFEISLNLFVWNWCATFRKHFRAQLDERSRMICVSMRFESGANSGKSPRTLIQK